MRLPDWKARLAAYIDAVRSKPFAYGTHDCALFAAGAIEAQTGVDPAEMFRGRYGTLRDGVRALKAEGYEDHISLARAVLSPVEPHYAQRGDIAVVRLETPALGVVLGAHVALLSEVGMVLFDLLDGRVTEVYRI